MGWLGGKAGRGLWSSQHLIRAACVRMGVEYGSLPQQPLTA